MYFQFFQESIDPKLEKLIQASMEGHLETVKQLITSGVDVNGKDPEYGDTALSQAAFKGHSDLIDYLLTQKLSSYSKNHALLLACQSGQIEIVDKLLKAGANVNVYMEDYHTPLFQVIAQNKQAVFERLLEEKNINIHFEDPIGVIPLLLAANNGRTEMFKQLLAKGADLSKSNKQGMTAESIANEKKYPEIIRLIHEHRQKAKTCTV